MYNLAARVKNERVWVLVQRSGSYEQRVIEVIFKFSDVLGEEDAQAITKPVLDSILDPEGEQRHKGEESHAVVGFAQED